MDDSPPHIGRPTWLEINPQGVVDNFKVAQKRVGAGVQVYPVVKANGYGLGATVLSQALMEAGAPGLCVGLVEEGRELREAGIDLPLVLFAGLTPGTEREIIQLNIRPFLYDLESAQALNQAALDLNRRVACYIKVDTGMARIGFSHSHLPQVLQQIKTLSALQVLGIVSHLACGDEGEEGRVSLDQIQRMKRLSTLPEVEQLGAHSHSLANSAGTLYHPQSHHNWVRPGIMLYGASPAYPDRSYQEDGLSPVVSWLSQIIQVRKLAPNTPLGYGHTFVTQRASRIAQIPVGYGDGYCRRLGNRAQVLISGHKAPVVGRVCMDLTAVDITDLPEAVVGSRVTLLGRDGAEFIGIEEMASWMETIPYEVICGLGKRLPRYYKSKGQ
jgi:alanine racemase